MATTWTKPHKSAAKAVFTTQTEAAPATIDDSEGLDIRNCESVVIHIEAAGNMTAGSKFDAYVFNRFSGKWNPCPDLNITIPSAVRYYCHPGVFVSRAGDRLAYVPNTVGQASDLYMIGATK